MPLGPSFPDRLAALSQRLADLATIATDLAVDVPSSRQSALNDLIAECRRIEGELAEAATSHAVDVSGPDPRYQELLDNSTDVLFALDLENNFTFVNRTVEGLSGYTCEELLGRNAREVLTPESVDRAMSMRESKLAGRVTTTYGVRLITKSGERVPLEVSTRLLFDGQKPVGVQGIARDIRERLVFERHESELTAERDARRLAERAADRTSRLQRVTAALSGSLTPVEVADVILTEGAAALGARAGSVALLVDDGRALEMLRSVGYPEEMMAAWQRFPVDGQRALSEAVRLSEPLFFESYEDYCQRYPARRATSSPSGDEAIVTVPLIANSRVLGAIAFTFAEPRTFDPDDRAFTVVLARQCAQALDRARLFEAERLARAEADAAARAAHDANRLKDEFLATLSHELRTPLNAIVGWARLLKDGKLDAASSTRAVDSIERNAKIQTNLIEELLDLSRAVVGKLHLELTVVDLSDVVHLALESIRPAADAKRITVECASPGIVPRVKGDSQRLQQIAWNLLANAIKFTPSGGRVDVTLRRLAEDVELRVTDSGVGIPREFLPYVFDRFRQADNSTTRAHGGLGLGLAIVRHLVELHGGTVRAESPGPGQGASFIVRLGATEYEGDVGAGEPATTRVLGLEGVRVLIVDDDPDSRDLIGGALELLGASIRTAESAEAALRILSSVGADVLLADIAMPGQDGYGLLQHVQRLQLSLPAAAISAYARPEDRAKSLRAGFLFHLPKPVNTEELASVVGKLAGRTSMQPGH